MSPITLYAQSDVDGKKIPVTSGGCGEEHLRPVIDGRRAKDFAIDCPLCEAVLRGDGKPRVLKYIVDSQTGRVSHQERVTDADPQWSSTPDTVPLTQDEQRIDKRFRETAQSQIDMMNALGTAIGNGLQIPREMMHFLQRGLPAETIRGLQATLVCPSGHDVPAGNAFCGSCGASMSGQKAITSEPAANLSQLHVAKLKKMARDRGLPDSGGKAELIRRLQAA